MNTASGSSVRFPRMRDSCAGNFVPLALNVPLVGLFVQRLRVP